MILIFYDKTHTGCRVFSSASKKVFSVLAGITSLLLEVVDAWLALGGRPGRPAAMNLGANPLPGPKSYKVTGAPQTVILSKSYKITYMIEWMYSEPSGTVS